jgi:hypothetical protein
MRAVSVTRTFPASAQEAERRWYDTAAWSAWVDGLDRVLDVEPPWPAVGGTVRWESGPAGRGRVTERVIAFEPAAGQTVEVDDASISGRQTVAFTPVGAGCQISLRLEYRLRRRSPVTPVVDVLFIRRAMTQSLDRTLDRFGVRLEDGGGRDP